MINDIFRALTQLYPYVSLIAILLVVVYDRKQMSIDLGGMAKFIGLLTLIMTIKLSLWDGSTGAINTFGVTLSHLKWVFLEDSFYVMIPFYINKKIDSPLIRFSVWTFFSGMFMSGHLYQGLFFATITLFYPYFISLKYSKKTTFATVMACHFMFDSFQIIMVKLHNLMSYV